MKIHIRPLDEIGIRYDIFLHVNDAQKIVDAINTGRTEHIPLTKTEENAWACVNGNKVAIRIPSQGGGTGYFNKDEVLEQIIEKLSNLEDIDY
ncbi:hypothetical protein [Desulfurobacterium crinifex]